MNQTEDRIYQAICSGRETPEIRTFVTGRLAAVRAEIASPAVSKLKSAGRENARKAEILQMSTSMLTRLEWHRSSLAEIAGELQDVLDSLSGDGTAATSRKSRGASSQATPAVVVTKGQKLADIRARIKREPSPLKRGQLAREARQIREGKG